MKKSTIVNPTLRRRLFKSRETRANSQTKYENTPAMSSKNIITGKNIFNKKFKDIAQFNKENNDLMKHKKNLKKNTKKKINKFKLETNKNNEADQDLKKIKEILSNSFDE